MIAGVMMRSRMQVYCYALKVLLEESLDRLIASSDLSLNNYFGSTLAHLSTNQSLASLKFTQTMLKHLKQLLSP